MEKEPDSITRREHHRQHVGGLYDRTNERTVSIPGEACSWFVAAYFFPQNCLSIYGAKVDRNRRRVGESFQIKYLRTDETRTNTVLLVRFINPIPNNGVLLACALLLGELPTVVV